MAYAQHESPTVWVVDDDQSVRVAVARLLRSAALRVLTLSSPDELLRRLGEEQPDCLLLDLWLDDVTALELVPLIHGCAGQVPLVFMSGSADVSSCVQAMKCGAIDFLEKPVDDGALLGAVIRAVARGRSWREARSVTDAAARQLSSLTPREREVFALVALGNPNKRIAAALGTTEKTIKVHRGRVMQKLGAGSVVDLVRLSDRAGYPAR
ncbi:MAG TPA: response regulator [Myxococcaceae bacterium]|nr:response regulator [Myxococcaceae bacterium]